MTGVAAAGADRGMTGHAHRVGHKTHRRIDVAVAALDARHRHMRRRGQAGRGGVVVASRTTGVGRSMSICSAQPRGGALVASLAWRGRGYVIRRLAQCGRTVVATDAIRRYSGVIHDGRAGEAHRTLVAISARRRRNQVVGGFAKSDRAIVTAGARSDRLGVVNKSNLPPRRSEVAALAEIGGLRMCLRLSDSSRTVVAGETLARRPLEASVDVA